MGLPGIIHQGTATLAYAARELVNREARGNPALLKALACRFTGMVRPGSDDRTADRGQWHAGCLRRAERGGKESHQRRIHPAGNESMKQPDPRPPTRSRKAGIKTGGSRIKLQSEEEINHTRDLTLKADPKWRTNANKSLRGLKGNWKVEVRDDAGKSLKGVNFKVE